MIIIYQGGYDIQNNIKLVEKIIKDAIDLLASDIHIRNVDHKCIIEYRINGILKKMPENNYNPLEIISRIKIMSKLNVAEKRLPQDGNIDFFSYDLRVCTMPSITGEFVVIRILNSYLKDINLKTLGYSNLDIYKFEKSITKKNGLILICGPTGSGKSTTLLSLTKLLDDGQKKIISIEDPIENRLDSIIQINVNDEINLTFSKILRSTLRLDPDIIIVSEIRDEITAKIAIRASLTGHLVISTLHTNDAIGAFSRLIDMGVKKYLLLDSIILISSQKLLNSKDNKLIKNRLLISETILFSDKIKDIFKKNDNKLDILKHLKKEGYKTMEDDFIEKCNNL